jgi:F-type H+-transporting ATPase subunit b
MKRILWFLFAAALPAVAFAGSIDEPGAAAHGIPWGKLALSFINLSIFVYILRRAAWPTLRNWAAERRARVADALAEADRAKREAEALRAEWQRRLDQLSGELEGMLQQARADIAVERDQILAAARKTAEAIHRDAQRTADSEIRNARDLLRAELAAQALAVAERLAPQQLTPADQRRFVDEFVQQVERP